jgi:hypothetical protein
MMKGILIKISFCPNEKMLEEPAQVFAELQDVVYFHLLVGFIEGVDISCEVGAITVASEPCGHEGSFFDDKIT